ncbi:MAG: HRDC domain-containing protein [Nannocystaceae bacterium]
MSGEGAVAPDQVPHLLCVVRVRPHDAVAEPELDEPTAAPPHPPAAVEPAGPARTAPRLRASTPEHDALRTALRRWRAAAAQEQGVPAYVVLTNRDIDTLAHERPAKAFRSPDGRGRSAERLGDLVAVHGMPRLTSRAGAAVGRIPPNMAGAQGLVGSAERPCAPFSGALSFAQTTRMAGGEGSGLRPLPSPSASAVRRHAGATTWTVAPGRLRLGLALARGRTIEAREDWWGGGLDCVSPEVVKG